jgi:hypothetical protein
VGYIIIRGEIKMDNEIVYKVWFFADGEWHEIDNVTADSSLFNKKQGEDIAYSVRVIFCKDFTRYELPMSIPLKFSPERVKVIKEDMEQNTGQRVKVKGMRD